MDISTAIYQDFPVDSPVRDCTGQAFIPGVLPPGAAAIDPAGTVPADVPDSVIAEGSTETLPRTKSKTKFIIQRLEVIKRQAADGSEVEEQHYIDMGDSPYCANTNEAVVIINRMKVIGKYRIVGASKIIEIRPNPQPTVIAVELGV